MNRVGEVVLDNRLRLLPSDVNELFLGVPCRLIH